MRIGMIALIQPPRESHFDFPKLSYAPTGLFFVIRPIDVSDMINTYPKDTVKRIYTSRKIPPPYFAARYGKRQICFNFIFARWTRCSNCFSRYCMHIRTTHHRKFYLLNLLSYFDANDNNYCLYFKYETSNYLYEK